MGVCLSMCIFRCKGRSSCGTAAKVSKGHAFEFMRRLGLITMPSDLDPLMSILLMSMALC
jgi:hypothetical protein